MKTYDMENQYAPYTGQHEGIVAIESDDGEWVPADVAQGLYEALGRLLSHPENGQFRHEAHAALAAADGEEV